MSEDLELYSEKELLIKLIEQQKKDAVRRKIAVAVITVCTLVLAGVLIFCVIRLRSDIATVNGHLAVLNESIEKYGKMFEELGLKDIDFSKLDPSQYEGLIESLEKLGSLVDWMSKSGWFK